MKSYARIENLLLKATPRAEGGYVVNGTLPWVSNLGSDHYCGAIAQLVDEAGRTMSEIVAAAGRGLCWQDLLRKQARHWHRG